MKTKMQIFCAIATLLGVASAQAAMIQYTNFSHEGDDHIKYTVTVSDDTAGFFDVTFAVAANSLNTTKKFTGFYFDVTGRNSAGNSPYNAGNINFLALNSTPNPSEIAFNDSKINGVTNLNLGEFDVIIGWKQGIDLSQSGASGSFRIADLGLSLNDWGTVGMRGQATGSIGGTDFGGSAKEISTVPLPAAAYLFGSALLGMAGIGYRRNKKQA